MTACTSSASTFPPTSPALAHPSIPGEQTLRQQPADALIRREHRLYQTDFLLRKYGFAGSELVLDATGNLPLDPKEAWALAHPEFFPLNAPTPPNGKSCYACRAWVCWEFNVCWQRDKPAAYVRSPRLAYAAASPPRPHPLLCCARGG
ncbi:MAG: hypothetical protein EPN23_06625 [Verrucomicrobia bacterium]|nr:MAG: hypothetical protein EPN23_06625 [Verrucomicrobiota bacterium]